jgi:hypothetical protein
MFSLKAENMLRGISFKIKSLLPDLQSISHIEMLVIRKVVRMMLTKRDQGAVFPGSTS